MRLRRYLTYPHVMSTLALFVAIGGSAFAINRGSVGTLQLRDDSIRTRDVRDGTIRGKDLESRAITSRELDEGHVDVTRFLKGASENRSCDPLGPTFLDCVTVAMNLDEPSQVLLVAGGGQESAGSAGADGQCRFEVDGRVQTTSALPVGELTDNSGALAKNGFGLTMVTDRSGLLDPGPHEFSLACNETGGDTRLSTYISAVSFGGTP